VAAGGAGQAHRSGPHMLPHCVCPHPWARAVQDFEEGGAAAVHRIRVARTSAVVCVSCAVAGGHRSHRGGRGGGRGRIPHQDGVDGGLEDRVRRRGREHELRYGPRARNAQPPCFVLCLDV
jgi:hypothetical protein